MEHGLKDTAFYVQKHIVNILHSCHNFPAGSRQAARGARICETSLLKVVFLKWLTFCLGHSALIDIYINIIYLPICCGVSGRNKANGISQSQLNYLLYPLVHELRWGHLLLYHPGPVLSLH